MNKLPEGFREQMLEMLGAEAPSFFEALDDMPALALRINPLKSGSPDAVRKYCAEAVPWEKLGFYIRENTRPGASIAHAAGAFYLQEASAMSSVNAFDPRPGERILDLCAAPGGKSSQIAGRMLGEGTLICNEIDSSRAKVLASNIERMGAFNTCVVSEAPAQLADKWLELFDGVLCDAPCSGEGMFRREPDARQEWNSASPEGCAKRQAEILDAAAGMVAPGGRLVYSTCTFNRLENEGTIQSFLSRHPEFRPEDFSLQGVGMSVNGMHRIWPHHQRGDGHFCARLRKDGEARRPGAFMPVPFDPVAKRYAEQMGKEVCSLSERFGDRFLLKGDYLYLLPKECPDLRGLKILTTGLQVLRIGKNYIEPCHALAMALQPEEARQVYSMNTGEAERYLAGEVLECGGQKGWILMTWEGFPLGWGKASNGQIKNHLPKGIRLKNVQ